MFVIFVQLAGLILSLRRIFNSRLAAPIRAMESVAALTSKAFLGIYPVRSQGSEIQRLQR